MKTAGSTYSFTSRLSLAGLRYWPMVTASHPADKRSSSTDSTSFLVSPRPAIMPDFVMTPKAFAVFNTSRDLR